MKNLRKTHAGFTLIEMLIVIIIIGILTVMAVGSFGDAQRRARLDIAVDSIVSLIKEQRSKAQAGRQVPDSSSVDQTLCYGLVFQKIEPFVQTVQVPYRATATDNTAKADYCDATTVPPVLKEVVVTKDILFEDIKQGGASIEKLVIMFKPPNGSVLETTGVEEITEAYGAPPTAKNPVEFIISQKGNEPGNQRGVKFDVFSGSVTRFSLVNPVNPVSP